MRIAILLALATLWLGPAPDAIAASAAAATLVANAADPQSVASAAHGSAEDPLNSARWSDMHKVFFAGQSVTFDPRVKLNAPAIAEDSLNVPVSVDAEAGLDMTEMLARPIPPQFRSLAEVEREYRRSVVHLFPAAEQAALEKDHAH